MEDLAWLKLVALGYFITVVLKAVVVVFFVGLILWGVVWLVGYVKSQDTKDSQE